MSSEAAADSHRFVSHPHRTLLALSLPVLVSLVAEPLTGLVDTFFVARLGTASLAALGISVTLISSVLWVFNFLGIGTQTSVAQALGSDAAERARGDATLAIAMGLGIGVVLTLLGWPLASALVGAMGATGDALADGAAYLQVRLLGGPAVLASMAAFGALRGRLDMRTPLWIAVVVNVLNALLDPLLIFGIGPFPQLGLVGAAWASTAAQWLGAGLAGTAVIRRLGTPSPPAWRDVWTLLQVGRDLFLRTGALMVFLTLTTAAANHIGTESGAAHQAVRQVWGFSAFLLDAYATAAQSLVGYFHAAARSDLARRVAGVACVWGLGTGAVITLAMLAGTNWVIWALVPEPAQGVFGSAWLLAALSQPVNALAFASDGIHWGTGDYRYLRNAMLAASAVGVAVLGAAEITGAASLAVVWLASLAWAAVRALLGVLRVWPGIGTAPLAAGSGHE